MSKTALLIGGVLVAGCAVSNVKLTNVKPSKAVLEERLDKEESARQQEEARKDRELAEYRAFAQDIFDNPENPGERTRTRIFRRGERVYEVSALDYNSDDNLEGGVGKIGVGDQLEIAAYQRTPEGLEGLGRLADVDVDYPKYPSDHIKGLLGVPEDENFEDWIKDVRNPKPLTPQENLARLVRSEGYVYGKDRLGREVYALDVQGDNAPTVPSVGPDKSLRRIIYFSGSAEGLSIDDRLDFEFRHDDIDPCSPLDAPRVEIDQDPVIITETYLGKGSWTGESCGAFKVQPGWEICFLQPVERDIDTSFIYAKIK